MNDETVLKVERALQVLAEKLGVGIDHFWPLAVRQQLLEGGISLGLWVGLVVLTLGLLYFVVVCVKRAQWLVAVTLFGVAGILGLLSMIGAAAGGVETLTQLLNPEYAALESVMDMVK